MKNPARDIPRYLRIFQTYLGRRMYLIFALSLIAGLAEGVGILILLPLLQTLDMGGNPVSTAPDGADAPAAPDETGVISTVFNDMFAALGLQDTTAAVLLIITLAFIAKGVLTFGAHGFNYYLGGQLLRQLKGRLFDAYSQMSYSYYASRNTGHFINLLNEQVSRALQSFYSLTKLGMSAINALVYLAIAFALVWRFGAMALLAGIVLLMPFRALSSYVRELSRKHATEEGQLNKLLIQTLQGFKYLTATAQTEGMKHGIRASISRLTGYQIRTGIASAFTAVVCEPVIVIFIAAILWVQLELLAQPLAPILVSILLFYRALNTLLYIQTYWQETLENIGSLELVDQEFTSQHQHREHDGTRAIGPLSRAVRLQDIHYRYNPAHDDVIRGISLELPARASVALVGKSGAGKSTLVDLLTLILKPRQGQILIDDVPGQDIELASWRRQLGYVSQEAVIFDDTIANNIGLWVGDPRRDDTFRRRILEAARQAHIAHFIETLPDGYDTLVGERGLRLSGGQRQRLFIARELFRSPRLLILDEATSALDSESERAIQQSIDELKGRITVVIIAHRLSTIHNVDRVYVLEKGQVVEQGSYWALRNREGSRLGKLIDMQAL